MIGCTLTRKSEKISKIPYDTFKILSAITDGYIESKIDKNTTNTVFMYQLYCKSCQEHKILFRIFLDDLEQEIADGVWLIYSEPC